MQDRPRDRPETQPAEPVPLVRADDEQIDAITMRHLEQVTVRSAPAGFYADCYFFRRQQRCDALGQIAFHKGLDFLRIVRQRQRALVTDPARFFRGPIEMDDSDLTRPELSHFI
jgi:hypothetical protein